MKHPTVAILSVSAGAGHLRAAEALKAAAEGFFPGLRAVHVDVLELLSSLSRLLYADSYATMVNSHPALWGYLYDATDGDHADSALNKLRQTLSKVHTGRLMSALEEISADFVICTHWLPPQLLARKIRKGEFDRPVWVQVTDFDVHAFWIHQHMSGYFVASEETALRLRDRGISPDTTHVTGIPVMPVFAEKLSRETCARELGIDPDRKTFLLMSGAAGVVSMEKFAERLTRLDGDFQVLALAGKNKDLLKTLKKLASKRPGRIVPLGFTKTIERLMWASDLAITKPGGLTSSECLAVGLPMILISPIPGQEERNADYLLENGVALKAYDEAGLEYCVRELLDDSERLESMRRRAGQLGRPYAAREVLRIALDGLSSER